MLKRCFLIIFVLLAIIPFINVGASENGVVINSFKISGDSSKDEFIEIYNAGNSDINLEGWRISKKTASGSNSNLLTAFSATSFSAGQKIIIAHPDCSCDYDFEYQTSTGTLPSGSLAVDNSIVLYSDNGKTIVDMVGFGEITSNFYEGSKLSNPNNGEIYSRKADGQDTDNNKNDFFISYHPPKKDPAPAEEKKPKTVKKDKAIIAPVVPLAVTEYLPNPEGPDSENEFIEIYNPGKTVEISGYFLTDIAGSPKKYKIPEGTTIGARAYLAFYSSKTSISLNNNGDGVAVLSPDGKEIDSSPDDCGKVPEGASYAFNGSTWRFTGRPTPGKENVFEEVANKEDSSSNEGEVLSLIDETELPDEQEAARIAAEKNRNDRILGYGLIVLAIIFGVTYTLYMNKETVVEKVSDKFRERYDRFREEVRKNRQR